MLKIITRRYAVHLLKKGKAVFSCFRKPDENGVSYTEIESLKTGQKMYCVYDMNDIALAIDYSIPESPFTNETEN